MLAWRMGPNIGSSCRVDVAFPQTESVASADVSRRIVSKNPRTSTDQGRENGVFGKRCFCSPYRKQAVLTKNSENCQLHATHQKMGFALPRKLMKMPKMAGATQAKPPFTKNTAFASPNSNKLAEN